MPWARPTYSVGPTVIGRGGKHNWDCRSRRPGSDYGGVATGRCEHRHLAVNQLGREHRQAIVLTICVPVYDPDILVRGVASFPEPILKGRQHVRCTSGRSALEEPNHWHRGLLCARMERPACRRAAEQRDELSALHGCPLLRLRAGHYHTVAEERRCASQRKLRDDVADGRKRTQVGRRGMSEMCQKRTYTRQQKRCVDCHPRVPGP
jgi:hypothetical protein